MSLELEDAKEQVERFITDTSDARDLSERCRDYFDHKQWTDAEAEKLRSRNQAPIVVNRVRPKVKGLIGLYNLRRSDPKAYARTKKHEKSSHAITDALRYVAENNDFDSIRINVAEQFFVEGYSAAAVTIDRSKDGDVWIKIEEIPWDRIYFDPHSRNKDYSDARFKGFYMWMYEDEAQEKFPKADIEALISSSDFNIDETFEDRPRWFDRQRKRVRVAVHFWIHKAVWHFGVFTESSWLIDAQPSPYLDEDGEPICPIELVSANINRDNERYGEVAGFLDQQDEINHRRSKALHLLNQRQTFGRKGDEEDIKALKRELSKPDGHVEFIGDEFGKTFGILPTNDMMRGQMDLYQDAKSEMDAVSFNAQLAGERQQGDLSGIAIDKLQAAGTVELNQDYALLAGWEKRIYRQIFARIKQYWTEEKWIRVTDDQDNLRWVGLNTTMTIRDYLAEQVEDDSLPFAQRRQLEQVQQNLLSLEQQQDDPVASQAASEQLERPISVSNPIPEVDMDILLDQSFDAINVQQEQFQLLAQFASGADIDMIELIELSQLRGKDELIEKIEKRRQAAAEATQGATQLEVADKQATIANKMADTEAKQVDTQLKIGKTQADVNQTISETTQKDLENILLATNPERVNSVSV